MMPNRRMALLYCSKKISALWGKISSKHNCEFCCLNCLHWFRTKSRPESHEKVCGNEDFCNVVMLSEDTKISQFNQYQKSNKTIFIIYAHFESFID